jgi:hypothetical protein
MRRVALVAALVLCAGDVAAQQSPYKRIKVRSCAYADSLLGPARDDTRGNVRGFHHKEKDSTYLITGEDAKRPHINFAFKIAGQRPTRDPAAQLVLWLRGDTTAAIAGVTSPAVNLLLDDSVTVVPAAVAVGRFEGPAYAPVILPVSALIAADDLMSIAQAKTIAVWVEKLGQHLSQNERRDLRASIRVAVCPP